MPEPQIGNVPFEEAIDHLRKKTNITTRYWDEISGVEHAKGFTVAGVTKAAQLEDFHNAVLDQLEQGGTITSFRKDFDKIVDKHGWSYKGKRGWRSRVIFDTNIRTSQAAGRWQQIIRNQQALQKRNPNKTLYLIYQTAGDNRVRPLHQSWDRKILPVDDPFWNTHYPPNGWGCRCIVRVVSESYLKRKKLKVSNSPEIALRQPINKRSGEIYPPTPEGIDVGWDYNVGKAAWFPDPARFTNETIGHKVSRLAVNSVAFKNLFDGKISGVAPVGYISEPLSASLGANTRKVVLSEESLIKQKERHPDLEFEEYLNLPDVFEVGLIVKDEEQVAVFFHEKSYLYKAVVKSTKDGSELYLTSFHRATAKNLRGVRKRGEVIREER
ncbi:MAG: phage minor head protein [Arenicellales bacterium]